MSYIGALLQCEGQKQKQRDRRSLQPFEIAHGIQWGIRIWDSGKEEGSGQGTGGLVSQP